MIKESENIPGGISSSVTTRGLNPFVIGFVTATSCLVCAREEETTRGWSAVGLGEGITPIQSMTTLICRPALMACAWFGGVGGWWQGGMAQHADPLRAGERVQSSMCSFVLLRKPVATTHWALTGHNNRYAGASQ